MELLVILFLYLMSRVLVRIARMQVAYGQMLLSYLRWQEGIRECGSSPAIPPTPTPPSEPAPTPKRPTLTVLKGGKIAA